MSIVLSKRLNAIAQMVTPGGIPADIGTDHGYIPIWLVQEGIARKAVAMDVRPGPLQRAAEHVRGCGLEDRIVLRLSDGVQMLEDKEADVLIIAGMGGALIERILTEGLERGKLGDIRELVLGAQSELPRVRGWIGKNDFRIADEEMVEEDGKYYPVIKAVRDAGGAAGAAGHEMTECELLYGPVLLAKRHPVLKQYLERERQLCEKICIQIRRSGTADENTERLKELQERLQLIQEAMSIMES